MKKLMLIGDSIRLGYQDEVAKCLEGEFEVWGSPDNGRFAKYTLNELERWFAECPDPDVIHWNNGLWDSAVVCKEDGAFTPPEEYLRYMSLILRELRKKTDKIIFATTTPVRDGSLNQHIEYIERLNDIIVPFMKSENIIINDLHSLVRPHKDELICDDRIHLNDEGKKVCAAAVAEMVRKMF